MKSDHKDFCSSERFSEFFLAKFLKVLLNWKMNCVLLCYPAVTYFKKAHLKNLFGDIFTMSVKELHIFKNSCCGNAFLNTIFFKVYIESQFSCFWKQCVWQSKKKQLRCEHLKIWISYLNLFKNLQNNILSWILN